MVSRPFDKLRVAPSGSRGALPMPFVYILRCSDNSFYVGHTDNLFAREEAHNKGTAAQYTARRRPLSLCIRKFLILSQPAMSAR